MKQVATQDNLEPTKEAIVQKIVGPTKLHTKLFGISYHIQLNMMILLLDAIECQMRFKSELSKKVQTISFEYKAWYMHLTQELQKQTPNMDFIILGQ